MTIGTVLVSLQSILIFKEASREDVTGASTVHKHSYNFQSLEYSGKGIKFPLYWRISAIYIEDSRIRVLKGSNGNLTKSDKRQMPTMLSTRRLVSKRWKVVIFNEGKNHALCFNYQLGDKWSLLIVAKSLHNCARKMKGRIRVPATRA